MTAGMLIRVGIDQESGGWNAPCSNDGRFCYVPIPEKEKSRARVFDRTYGEFSPHVAAFGIDWPESLGGKCHLDPDFSQLTYGDTARKATRIRRVLAPRVFMVFYSAMRCVETGQLVCSIIGYFVVSVIANAAELGPMDWHRNAHTRRAAAAHDGDVVVFSNPASSGRLARHIPIGKYRDRAQRVYPELLQQWGDLKTFDCTPHKGGYLQRSGAPPIFANVQRFTEWFATQRPVLVHANNL